MKTIKENKRRSHVLTAATLMTAAGYYGSQKLLNMPVKYDANRLRYLAAGIPEWQTIVKSIGLPEGYIPARAVYLNSIRAIEESLFGIPKSLGISDLISHKLFQNTEILFESKVHQEHLIKHSKYYSRLTGVNPEYLNLNQETFRYSGNKLYLAAKENGTWVNKRILLDSADLHVAKFQIGDKLNHSRFLSEYQSNLGITPARFSKNPQSHEFGLLVTGGKNKYHNLARKAGAYASDLFKTYLRVMDDPFETASKFLDSTGLGTNLSRKIFGRGSDLLQQFGLKNRFGAGGSEFLGRKATELMKRHLTHGIPTLVGGFLAYKAVNRITAETGLLPGGISGTFASAAQGVGLAWSHVSEASGLTWLKEKQEKLAPGSTSLGAVLAFPLAGMLTGGLLSGGKTVIDHFSHSGVDPLLSRELKTPFKLGIKAQGLAANIDEKLGTSIKGFIEKILPSEATRFQRFTKTGALIGMAMSLPFLPGALGSKYRPEERKKIYSGEQFVPIKKGRYWEMGMGAYEGEGTDYYAPHWTVRFIKDMHAKGMYQDLYGHPFKRWLGQAIDPYYIERHMDKKGYRKYDVWGPSDLGLGFIGKIYKHTIGKILKPPVYFYKNDKERERLKATDPYSMKAGVNEVFQAFTEATGLKGFVMRSIASKFTHRQTLFEQDELAQSAERIGSLDRQYFDANIGSGLGNTEVVRRMLIDQFSETQYIDSNKVNNMPSWMPEHFKTGDPYAKIPGGEYRLPGAGYAALHPELRKLTPEQYPDAYKLSILGNVAPYSKQRIELERKVQAGYEYGKLAPGELQAFAQFSKEQEAIAAEDKKLTYEPPDNWYGKYWNLLGKVGRGNPLEHLTPFAPVHKFAPSQDPLEKYKDLEVLDSNYKMWDHPVRDFLAPTVNKALNELSFGAYVPKSYETSASIEEQFQKIQFVKNQMLAQEMKRTSDAQEQQQLASQMRRTMYDVSPYAPEEQLTKFIPRSERQYFNAFAKEQNPRRREAIMHYVPNYMREIYNAQWEKEKTYEIQDKIMRGDRVSSDEKNYLIQGEQDIASRGVSVDRHRGLKIIGDENENYRKLKLQEITENNDLPNPNSTVWASNVSVDAVKAKVIMNEGMNLHDFDLWNDDEEEAHRLPNDVVYDINVTRGVFGSARHRLKNQLHQMGLTDVSLTMSPHPYGNTNIVTTVDVKPYIAETLRNDGYIG